MNLITSRFKPSLLNLPGCDQLECFISTMYGSSFLYASAHDWVLSGTSPAISATGTLLYPWDIRLKCTAGGARGGGSALQFSLDGGATYNGTDLPTGATVAGSLLTATGLTLSLLSGTFVLNDTWRIPYGTWNDLSLKHRQYLTTGSGKDPVLDRTVGINGRPALVGDGISQVLDCVDPAYASAMIGGEDTPCTIIWVGKDLAVTSTKQFFWCYSNGVASTGALTCVALSSQWAIDKRGDTGGEIIVSGGSVDNTAHVFAVRQNGTTADLFVDGAHVISAAAQNAPFVTASRAQLFGIRGVANLYANVALGEVGAYRGALPNNTIQLLSQWEKYLWGTP